MKADSALKILAAIIFHQLQIKEKTCIKPTKAFQSRLKHSANNYAICFNPLTTNDAYVGDFSCSSSSGNRTPGSRFYSDLVDTWADRLHPPARSKAACVM